VPPPEQDQKAQVTRVIGIAQIGFVTADIDAAIEVWSARYGVGPWRKRDFGPANVSDQHPVPFSMRLATTSLGDVDLELIEPLDDAGEYARSLFEHGGADHLHHLLVRTESFAGGVEDFARAGVPQAAAGTTYGTRFVYFDTRDELGVLLELIGPAADLLGTEEER
jgi:hypothetical protein